MPRSTYTIIIAWLLFGAGCATPDQRAADSRGASRWRDMQARVKHRLAEQQFAGQLFEDATRTATESIALDPQQPDAYALLAKANLERGRLASAQRALDAAEQAGVTSPAIHYLRGVVHEQRDRLNEALAEFERARELDPTRVDYLIAQAETLVALDRPTEALALLEDGIEGVDDDATVMALAAHIETLTGRPDRALERFRQAIRAGGQTPLVLEELARLLIQAGRHQEALATLGPLLETTQDGPPSPSVRRYAGACYLATNDARRAREHLEAYVSANPDDAHGQLLFAKAALATGDALTALAAVDRAAQRDPDNPELWLVRAAAQWQRGNLSSAAADLYDYLANRPDDPDAHCLLAEVLRARRNADAARRHFRQALQLKPDSAWAQAGLRAIDRGETVPAEPATPALTAEFNPSNGE